MHSGFRDKNHKSIIEKPDTHLVRTVANVQCKPVGAAIIGVTGTELAVRSWRFAQMCSHTIVPLPKNNYANVLRNI